MLTLNPDSVCDVCAEEYGPFNLPRCIPCGHVLCESCATTIVEKTSPRLQPACPFCREHFTIDTIRVIRIDFSQSSGGGASGSSASFIDPLRHSMDSAVLIDDETVLYDVRRSRSAATSARNSRDPSRATSRERGVFPTIDEDRQARTFDLSHFDAGRHKERAVELEKKVAKVATKRCSAEEVQALQKELSEWLSFDKTMGSGDNQQHTAIHLSHLLLRAILMNHVAHSEATKVAKGAEAQLRSRIADGDLIREKLDDDLRRHKNLLASRTQEVMSLKGELSRLKGGAVTPTRRQSLSAPTSPDAHFSFSSASTSVPAHSTSNPVSNASSPCSSGRTTPTAGLALSPPFAISPNGTSSASAAAAALEHPCSSSRYHHSRSATLVHRSTTPSPAVHAVSSASSTLSSSRRAMTPAPVHQRSASVAPGAASSIPRFPTLQRSMTPGIHAMSTLSRSHAAHALPTSTLNTNSGAAHPNGSSAGVNPSAGGSVPPVPPIPVPVSQLSHSMNSLRDRDTASISTSPGGHPRPPVPPKPRTLSQSTGTQASPPRHGGRGVVDDRDGYATEKETKEKEKREKRSRHERWLPSALVDRMSRPMTSQN